MSAGHVDSRRAMWLMAVLTVVVVAACVAERTAGGAPPVTANVSTADATAKASARPNVALAFASATADSAAPSEFSVADASPQAVSAAVMPDVDYWATPQPVVDRMLQLARVKASDVVYDLGCGDARSLVTAAQRYGARSVGFDIDPRLVAEARDNARRHGVDKLVQIEQADIFTLDLSHADVIFLYMTPRFNLRLVPQLQKLRPGSRIVSHEFEIPGAKPTRVVQLRAPRDGPPEANQQDSTVMHKIYLWNMPWQKQWTDWKQE